LTDASPCTGGESLFNNGSMVKTEIKDNSVIKISELHKVMQKIEERRGKANPFMIGCSRGKHSIELLSKRSLGF
jgi:hypothetical protein